MNNWKAVWPKGEDAPFELYDLSTDVRESMNVAEQYPDVVNERDGRG